MSNAPEAGLTLFRPEIVAYSIYIFITHILWEFQPNQTKIAKVPYKSVEPLGRIATGLAFLAPKLLRSPLYGCRTFSPPPRAGGWPFSARNCYIANLLFYGAHYLKISAQMDQNCQSSLYGRDNTPGTPEVVLIFYRPKIATLSIYPFMMHILWTFQPKRTKIGKVPDRGVTTSRAPQGSS